MELPGGVAATVRVAGAIGAVLKHCDATQPQEGAHALTSMSRPEADVQATATDNRSLDM